MKCVVTGGNGFIGKYVSSSLISRGYDVVIYDNVRHDVGSRCQNCEFVYGDIRDRTTLSRVCNDASFVFHLSGVLGTSELFATPQLAIETNIIGTLNVILSVEAADAQPRLFLPAKPNHWDNIYSVTSQATEKLGLSYLLHKGLNIRILRFYNVYGPHQRITPVRKAVPMFICQALENNDVEIYGDGTQLANLIYAKDLAEVIVNYVLLDTTITEMYEIQSGISIKVSSLARKIIQMTSSGSILRYLPPRLGEQGVYSLKAVRDIQQILGQLAFTPLAEGLFETIEAYRMISGEQRHTELAFYK